MKLIFDGVTLGGGSNYFLDDATKGLSGELNNVTLKIPRTDFSKNIADFLQPKIRVFTGTIVGDDVEDFRAKKRSFVNKLRQIYTFTLQDDYTNADGTTTIYEEYEFAGKIVEFDCNLELRSNMGRFRLQIFCEDPLLYLTTAVTDTSNIKQRGFTFPLVFPFVFTGRDNVLEVDNTGEVDVYPTITIHGAGTNFEIINESSEETNKVFTFTGTLNNIQELVLTPIITDPIKARLDGISVIQYTNNNFEALRLKPGANTLTFFLESGEDSFTEATISFKPAFIGI